MPVFPLCVLIFWHTYKKSYWEAAMAAQLEGKMREMSDYVFANFIQCLLLSKKGSVRACFSFLPDYLINSICSCLMWLTNGRQIFYRNIHMWSWILCVDFCCFFKVWRFKMLKGAKKFVGKSLQPARPVRHLPSKQGE